MATTGDGRPFFAEGFHAAGFFVPEFFGEVETSASTDPFGDFRYTAFGARVRRTAGLLVLFLTLLGTG